jgi:MFS family permease
VSGISLAAGPVLGGVLVAYAGGWRGIFWFNLVFGLAALAAAAWTLPESSDPQGRKLDVGGLAAGVIAVSALTFAVIDGENVGFSTWWIELLFALAAATAVLFVLIERRTGDPVVRLEYFRIPAYSSANAVAFATSFGLFAVFFFRRCTFRCRSSSRPQRSRSIPGDGGGDGGRRAGRRSVDGGTRPAGADGDRPSRRRRILAVDALLSPTVPGAGSPLPCRGRVRPRPWRWSR